MKMSKRPGITKVHIWLSGKFSSSLSFGHVALETDECYISFWPEDLAPVKPENSKCKASWFESHADEIAKYEYPLKTININNLDTTKIEDWWEQYKKDPKSYSAVTNSCCRVVYTALCKGSDEFIGTVIGIVTPKAFGKLLERRVKSQKGTASSSFVW